MTDKPTQLPTTPGSIIEFVANAHGDKYHVTLTLVPTQLTGGMIIGSKWVDAYYSGFIGGNEADYDSLDPKASGFEIAYEAGEMSYSLPSPNRQVSDYLPGTVLLVATPDPYSPEIECDVYTLTPAYKAVNTDNEYHDCMWIHGLHGSSRTISPEQIAKSTYWELTTRV